MIDLQKIFLITTFFQIQLFGHCQIPCGIYSDAMQIMQIKEDLRTIDKSMRQIIELSKKTDAQSINQLNRWISSKDKHAQNIQKITSEYFLTQRIKENSKSYSKKVVLLHRLLVSAMKCKQSTDKVNVSNCYSILESFIKLYFDKHGIEHLNNLREPN